MNATMGADVLVVGAGAIGCSIAYQLARAGIDVLVVDRGDLASGSSGACDGYVVTQTKHPGIHAELALKSVEAFEHLSDELRWDVQYERVGGLIIIRGPGQRAAMERHAAALKESGIQVEMLDRRAVADREPFLDGEYDGATYCGLDGRVDPLNLTRGFAAAASRLGAGFSFYNSVASVVVRGDRVTGVVTSLGFIACRVLILASGVWTAALLEPLGLHVPIKPRRGIVLVTEPVPPLLNHVVLDARYIAVKFGMRSGDETCGAFEHYGVGLALEQTADGNILIGNTREFVGFDRRVAVEPVSAVRSYALRVAPRLGGIGIIRSFAGLRPYTPDGLPLLGPVEGVEGLVLAAGHEGDGIALSPITGRIVADYVCSGMVSREMRACLPGRFDIWKTGVESEK
ncbi:MAG: FAD-binding oxidoreductase [Firmicutes bacterium]|nr:FAD-binding oxidoreductase [Bacillota bacterium]